MRQRRGTLRSLADIADGAGHPAAVGIGAVEIRRQRIRVAKDDLQQIVEIVGDAAGQLTDRFHLLRLMQRFLRLPAAGDVELRAEEVYEVAGGIVDRADEQRVPEGRAVLPIILEFEGDIRLVRNRRLQPRLGLGIGVRSLQEAAIAADDLGLVVARHRQEGLVDEDDRLVGQVRIDHRHRHARHLDGGEEDAAAGLEFTTADAGLDARMSAVGRLLGNVGHRKAVLPRDRSRVSPRSSLASRLAYLAAKPSWHAGRGAVSPPTRQTGLTPPYRCRNARSRHSRARTPASRTGMNARSRCARRPGSRRA